MRIPELLASLPPAPQEGPVFLVNTMHGVHVGPFTTRGDADLASMRRNGWWAYNPNREGVVVILPLDGVQES